MRTVCASRLLSQCLLLLFGLSLGWPGNAGEPGPIIPKGKGDRCVAETDFMRRNHMDLIVHQRDETVIRGIRDEPFSLVECVDCHAQQNASNEPVRIDAEGQFCASCHSYVAVKIDCFGCHAAVPDVDKLSEPERVDSIQWLPHKQLMAYKPAKLIPLNSSFKSTTNKSTTYKSTTQSVSKSALERDRNELNSTEPE